MMDTLDSSERNAVVEGSTKLSVNSGLHRNTILIYITGPAENFREFSILS